LKKGAKPQVRIGFVLLLPLLRGAKDEAHRFVVHVRLPLVLLKPSMGQVRLALRIAEGDIVIRRLHRKAFDTRFLGRPFLQSPTLEHAVLLRPEVEVVRLGKMFLDHEDRHCLAVLGDNRMARWSGIVPWCRTADTILKKTSFRCWSPIK
jgi:hypothetical protein